MALQEELEKEGNWLFRYRSYLPLAMLATSMAFCAFFMPEKVMKYWNYYEYICLAVSLLGMTVRIITVGHTPSGTSGRNTKGQVANSLNTTGIYSMVRHPLYLGNFLMYLGIAMLTANVWFIIIFLLVFWLYYERIMFAEEQFLRHKFGDDYVEWATHTPAIIPSFIRHSPPACSFSWKKAVKKEKNGLFALFLIFFLIDTIIRCHEREDSINIPLTALAIATGAAYVVLKFLKKHTCLLDEEGR